MHQPPFLLHQAASNARWITGPAFSESAAEAIRTSRSPVLRWLMFFINTARLHIDPHCARLTQVPVSRPTPPRLGAGPPTWARREPRRPMLRNLGSSARWEPPTAPPTNPCQRDVLVGLVSQRHRQEAALEASTGSGSRGRFTISVSIPRGQGASTAR